MPRILYTEDDLNLSYVTSYNLRQHGYEIVHCADGEQALETFRSSSFDLCLLDVMLPKMDGFELAGNIRRMDSEVPIIFLTVKSMTEDKIHGLKQGADDYITKPFHIEELMLKIEVFLKRSSVLPKNAPFRIGSLSFDTESLVLCSPAQHHKLTLKEAELLRYFYLHRNKVLKREDILNTVWGNDDYFLGRSLDVFVSRLRKYLSKEEDVKIENIHGVGFRLTLGRGAE
jgi:DNA-binding response OmpR family regulator